MQYQESTSPLSTPKFTLCAFITMVFLFLCGFCHASFSAKQTIFTNVLKLPLAFEKNNGQIDNAALYFSHGNHYSLFFNAKEIILALRSPDVNHSDRLSSPQLSVLKMKFVGSNTSVPPNGALISKAKSHYLLGNDPSKWNLNVSQYAKIQYLNLYVGIDAVFYGNQQQLKYDIHVAPNADLKQVKLSIDGAASLLIDKNGDLVLTTSDQAQAIIKKPIFYQMNNTIKKSISGHFILDDEQQVGFSVGEHDPTKPLTIEQSLSATVPVQSNHLEQASSTDKEGNIYITG